jgi:hypothetical protein
VLVRGEALCVTEENAREHDGRQGIIINISQFLLSALTRFLAEFD